MAKAAPEGFVYDGEHLVEAGLGTWHIVYDCDGRPKGAIFCPFPIPPIEYTVEETAAIKSKSQRKAARKRRKK